MEKIMQHRLATPVFQPRMHFFDKNGKPLVGGKAYSFKVGTDEFKPTYRNSEFTAANQNPILLDQAGSALIYVRGSNQLKIYNKQGNLIEEKIVYQQQMQTQFFDNYGKALSNGKIWTYDYQSTIKKASYKNADEALLNSNPVVLDQNGWGSISIVGAYRLRVLNKNNVVIGDQDFKRPPVQVLTSRVYPLYFEEGVACLFKNFNTTLFQQPSFRENISSDFVLLSAHSRGLFNTYSLIDSLDTGFTIFNATLETNDPYKKTTIQPENIQTLFLINSARQRDVVITHNIQSEKVGTGSLIVEARLTI